MAANAANNQEWFLRTNGETVFGPVSREGLRLWAEQGRILPGHEVSNDRKNWQPATGVEFLAMRCFIDEGEGELRGPLNRLAAEALLKSGKVAKDARLIDADDLDRLEKGSDSQGEEQTISGKSLPENILQQRIRELEGMVNEQRERLNKLTETNASETLQKERDVLAGLLQEAEQQRDAFKQSLDKESQTSARKQEALSKRIITLEQRLEEAVNRETAAQQVTQAATSRELDLQKQVTALENERRQLANDNEERGRALQRVEEELKSERETIKQYAREVQRAESARLEAVERVAAVEQELAVLLTDANARDQEYREKISLLEKDSALSPEERAQLQSDQVALYELIKSEIAALSECMEGEREHLESLRELGQQRQQEMLQRRQSLLQHLGRSPADMAQRASREQPSDAQSARLRADLENLRVTYQREIKFAESREREQKDKIAALEADATRYRQQGVEYEKQGQALSEARDSIRELEAMLAELSKWRDAEREQFASSQQALLARIEQLERQPQRPPAESMQANEARSVKLASWMRLKG